jgi:hypothetical protein
MRECSGEVRNQMPKFLVGTDYSIKQICGEFHRLYAIGTPTINVGRVLRVSNTMLTLLQHISNT